MTDKKKFKELLKKLPNLPGIYKMIDMEGRIIYLGKAKNLRKRVKSYFIDDNKDIKTERMLSHVEKIDYIVVDSELEAFILESNLIKELKPKYNILLKDDKNFAYIKIDLQEDFPKINVVREVLEDKAKYFGPKLSSLAAKETLKFLKKIFPYRHCPLKIELNGEKLTVRGSFKYPCLDYYIKRCPAPCIGKCDKNQYGQNIKKISAFLSGKIDEVKNLLTQEMKNEAEKKKFEKAAKIRDKIQTIDALTAKQKISNIDDKDSDIFGIYLEAEKAYISVFQIRNKMIINEINFILENPLGEKNMSELLKVGILSFYDKNLSLPEKIVLPIELEEKALLEKWILAKEEKAKGKIIEASSGIEKNLCDLALKNAVIYAEKHKNSAEKWQPKIEEALENLKRKLKISAKIKRIECYDISHLSGTMQVGSMVVFANGLPNPADYRMFKLRLLKEREIDDYKSIKEVLERRLKWLIREKLPSFIKIKIAKEKDFPAISEFLGIKQEKIKNRSFCLGLKAKKIFFILEIEKMDENSAEIKNFWPSKKILQEKASYAFLSMALKKYKARKYYVRNIKELEKFYLTFGFRHINNENDKLLMESKNLASDKSFLKKPDLILIDGGKGQLNAANEILRKYEMKIPLIAIAKKNEEIFIDGIAKNLPIAENSPESFLLQRLRDEAHRFAIEFNRSLRSKNFIQSSLDEIAGLSKIKAKKLLTKFASVQGIKEASLEDLQKIVGNKTALRLKSDL